MSEIKRPKPPAKKKAPAPPAGLAITGIQVTPEASAPEPTPAED